MAMKTGDQADKTWKKITALYDMQYSLPPLYLSLLLSLPLILPPSCSLLLPHTAPTTNNHRSKSSHFFMDIETDIINYQDHIA